MPARRGEPAGLPRRVPPLDALIRIPDAGWHQSHFWRTPCLNVVCFDVTPISFVRPKCLPDFLMLARAALMAAMLGAASQASAQSSDADLEMRIQQLENQLRQLTGQNEELQYRNRQLEDRLRQLGGAAPGGQAAVAQPNVAAIPAPGSPPAADPAGALRSADCRTGADHPGAAGAAAANPPPRRCLRSQSKSQCAGRAARFGRRTASGYGRSAGRRSRRTRARRAARSRQCRRSARFRRRTACRRAVQAAPRH